MNFWCLQLLDIPFSDFRTGVFEAADRRVFPHGRVHGHGHPVRFSHFLRGRFPLGRHTGLRQQRHRVANGRLEADDVIQEADTEEVQRFRSLVEDNQGDVVFRDHIKRKFGLCR